MAEHRSFYKIAQQEGVDPRDVLRVMFGQPGVEVQTYERIVRALRSAGLVSITDETDTKKIGVFSPTTGIGDYIGSVLEGIRAASQRSDYALSISLSSFRFNEQAKFDLFSDKNLAGIITLYPDRFEIIYQATKEYKLPVVFIDYEGEIDLSNSPVVMVNNRESIVNGVQYLVSLGHSRIGFVSGREGGRAAAERLLGFREGVKQAGLPRDESLILKGDWFQESGRAAAQQLLSMETPPTAIIAANDLMAFGVMEVAREMGLKIGTDLSVMGFDDVAMAGSVVPSLTTIRQPMFQIGETAFGMLLEILEGRTPDPLHVRLQTELIIRDSTGKAPD